MNKKERIKELLVDIADEIEWFIFVYREEFIVAAVLIFIAILLYILE